MKAAVLREVKQPLVIEEVALDEPGPGQVMVKTSAAGICHSDLHFIEGLWPVLLPAAMKNGEVARSVIAFD
ncbi:MAG: alcohol dehydrogenase catalytic domain-containing protein [Chloroflexi bacterium]|nr:alcohol dehydrogenase catalytic domain-containing protein [Chloroflexota bacterium]